MIQKFFSILYWRSLLIEYFKYLPVSFQPTHLSWQHRASLFALALSFACSEWDLRLWLRGPLQAKAAKAQGTAGSVGERKTGRAPLRPRCLGRPMGTLSGSAGATLPPFPPHLCCRTTQGGLAACFEGETPLRRDTSPSGPAASAGFRWPPGSQRRREDQSAGLDAGGWGWGCCSWDERAGRPCSLAARPEEALRCPKPSGGGRLSPHTPPPRASRRQEPRPRPRSRPPPRGGAWP